MSSLGDVTFGRLLEDVAAKTPAPGGGAVASAAAALAAALGEMVVAYSVGKKSLAAHAAELEAIGAALAGQRAIFLDLSEQDARAYERVAELLRRPAGDAERERAMPGAVAAAINVPRTALSACADLMSRLERLVEIGNERLKSDTAVAAALCEAAGASAAWNVRANLPLLESAEERVAIEHRVAEEVWALAAARAAIERGCGGAATGNRRPAAGG